MIKLNKRKFTKICSNLISNDHKGITLVALIITIILMLILVGVTINIAINGELFSKTKEAVKQTEIAAQKEKIDAERINIIAEQISKGLTSKEFMDRYEEELRKSKDFEGAVITRKDEGTIEIITKEGYKYEITEEGTNYTGSTEAPEEPQTPTDLNKSNTSFEYNIKGWTNQKVKVKIKVTGKIEGTLQYSRDGKSWTEYKGEEIEISDNNTSIYARVINSEGKAGTVWTGNIENIDRLAPIVSIAPNGGNYAMPSEGQARISTVLTAEDQEATSIDGKSGIKTAQYAWSTSNTEEPTEGWTDFDFTSEATIRKEDITAAERWYLWTKVIDKAGNRAENIKVSNAFIVGGAETEANEITLTPSTNNWTNGEVTVEAKYGANLTRNQTLTCEGTEGTDYTISGQVVTVYTNGKMVTATAEDAEGNKVVATITITKIDKTEPTITLTQTNTTTKEYEKTISVTPSVGESGVSVVKYALGDQNVAYFANNGTDITGRNSFTVSAQDYPTSSFINLSNNVYTVYLKNGAGKEVVEKITVTNLLLDYEMSRFQWLILLATGYG